MIIQGDCTEKLRDFEESSFTAVVTDPPYGLDFVGIEKDATFAGIARKRVAYWYEQDMEEL